VNIMTKPVDTRPTRNEVTTFTPGMFVVDPALPIVMVLFEPSDAKIDLSVSSFESMLPLTIPSAFAMVSSIVTVAPPFVRNAFENSIVELDVPTVRVFSPNSGKMLLLSPDAALRIVTAPAENLTSPPTLVSPSTTNSPTPGKTFAFTRSEDGVLTLEPSAPT
jgi:hypothetical protein